MYLIRLDDASEYMDCNRWDKIEQILDKYNIKPIVGIIPKNKDKFLTNYKKDDKFYEKVHIWIKKGWSVALHGFEHVYLTCEGGINPVQKRSEFAGLSIDEQKKKIREGYSILKEQNIDPKIFFAPSHTFDINTLIALKSETQIRVISDTIANDIYFDNDFYFIPQQSGHVMRLPFKITTFCYHPNTMLEREFELLENFLKHNRDKFISFDKLDLKKRKLSLYDRLLRKLYFLKRS